MNALKMGHMYHYINRIKVELVSKYSHWAQLEPKEGPIAVGLLSGQDNLRKSRVRNYLF